MKTKTWTVFGAGHFINDIQDAIESNGQALKAVVLNMELSPDILNKIPHRAELINIDKFRPFTDCYFFGFTNPDKQDYLQSLAKYNLVYANLIHKFSHVARTVTMGQGNFVGAGAVLAPNVRLGNFNFVNRTASIGHDTQIGSFNHFTPGCTVAGMCKIGSRNFFGIRSAIIDNLTLGDGITVGAGGVVVKDTLKPGTYIGVPARLK
ncbi:MAG: hypothetical protein WB588_06415 [Dehalococcoidia bacterium]